MSACRAARALAGVLAAVGCNLAFAAAGPSAATAAAGAGAGVSSTQALDALNQCVARLDPQIDIGYDRIAVRCPDLTSQLDHAPWSAWLPADWKASGNDLSAASLRDLRSLITRELQTRPGARTAQVASLKPIFGQLDLQTENQGAWARFNAWLRDAFTPGEQDPREGWLSRLFGLVSVSDTVARLISWACLGVVVVLATAIVANELRVAGVFTRRRSLGKGARRGAPMTAARSIEWEDVQSAPAGERARLLLQLIAARLVASGGLPPAEGLTVRELVRVAQLPNSGDRDLLVDIALAAERVRFSADPVPTDSIEVALAHGRTLLDHLEARA